MPCNLVAVQMLRVPNELPPQLVRAVLMQKDIFFALLTELLGEQPQIVTAPAQGAVFYRLRTRQGTIFISPTEIEAPNRDLVDYTQRALRRAGLLLVQQAVVETTTALGAEVVSDEFTAEGRIVRLRR